MEAVFPLVLYFVLKNSFRMFNVAATEAQSSEVANTIPSQNLKIHYLIFHLLVRFFFFFFK